jgi:predicted nucleotidyltransferase
MSPKSTSVALRLATSFRDKLSAALGKPVKVILYGSQARGEAIPTSDIDLLVVLPDLKKTTLDMALDVAWEVGFDAGKVLSVVPATENELGRLSASPFFRSVQKEGIVV